MDPGQRFEMIRARAYELWELRGRPEGREWEHWLEAEHEFRTAESQDAPRVRRETQARTSGAATSSASGARTSSAGKNVVSTSTSHASANGWLAWLPEWLRQRATDLEAAAQRFARGRPAR